MNNSDQSALLASTCPHPTEMLRLTLAICFVLVWQASTPAAQQSLPDPSAATAADSNAQSTTTPTQMQVVEGQAKVWSGPSEDYYPTAILKRGSQIDVYHETEDGWLGIRPPTGSFSWVPAGDAYLLPGGKVIEITSPKCVSWIGTELGTAKQYRWQVKLEIGEQLALLGEATVEGKDSEGEATEALWYKITPPAGEFRWVQAAGLRPTLESSQVRTPASKNSPANRVQTASGESRSAVDSSAVTTASYQEDVFADGPVSVEALPMPANVQRGGMMPGETIYEGEVYADESYNEGDVFYEPGYAGEVIMDGYVQPMPSGEVVIAGQSSDRWRDWHAVEMTDSGMRFPLLERIFNRNHVVANDPLNYDPYDLSMTPSIPRMTPTYRSVPTPNVGPTTSYVETRFSSPRGRTPWRDPALLRSQRVRGDFQTGDARQGNWISKNDAETSGDAMENIDFRDDFEASGDDSFAATSIADRINASRERLNSELRESGSMDSPPSLEQRLGRIADTTSGLVGSLVSNAQQLRTSADERLIDAVNWNGLNTPAGSASAGTREPNSFAGRSGTTDSYRFASNSSVQSAGNRIAATDGDVESLKLRLSEIVAAPMANWKLADLKDQTTEVIEHGETPIVRGKARLLLERIEEFESLAARAGVNTNVRTAGFTTSQSSAIRPASFVASSKSISSDSLRSPSRAEWTPGNQDYEATGWLVPVHASRDSNGAGANRPGYALTDDAGKIIAYVSALSGMKLDGYLNQPVGINGLRGYLPQLQAGHIQAQRIVRLR